MVQEENTQQHSVRKLLMPPLLGGLAVLLVFLGLVTCWQYYKSFERKVVASQASATRLFESAVKDYQTTMGALLEVFGGDTRLYPLLEQGDAKGLSRLYANVFRTLYNRNGISYLTFMDARQRVVLRMHDPKRFGDVVSRNIFQAAASMRYPVAGVGVSRDGRLTMRMVMALFSPETGELTGYVETGATLESVFDVLMQESGMDLAFIVEKEHMNAHVDSDGSGMRSASAVSWVDVDENTLVYSSLPSLDAGLARELVKESAPLEDEKRFAAMTYAKQV